MKMKFWIENESVFLKVSWKNYEHVKKNNYVLCFHFHNLLEKEREILPSKSQKLR